MTPQDEMKVVQKRHTRKALDMALALGISARPSKMPGMIAVKIDHFTQVIGKLTMEEVCRVARQ